MEATGLSTMQLRQQMPALANKTYFNKDALLFRQAQIDCIAKAFKEEP